MPSRELMVKAVDAAFTAQVELLFRQLTALPVTAESFAAFQRGFRVACDGHERAMRIADVD